MRENITEGKLGIARPVQNRMVSFTVEFMNDVAVDIRDYWQAVLARAEASSSSDWRRIERRHLEDACVDIMDVVRGLPLPLREICVARAVGLSWPKICGARPDRVRFSMEDDHEAALRIVWERAGAAVRRVV